MMYSIIDLILYAACDLTSTAQTEQEPRASTQLLAWQAELSNVRKRRRSHCHELVTMHVYMYCLRDLVLAVDPHKDPNRST